MAAMCPTNWSRGLNALHEGSENILDEVHEQDELSAWCVLEESDSGQWQEVISK